MNTLLGFGVLILVIINFGIYHKFVTSFYTDFVGGCATEIFWIAIFTAFEIAIIKGIILKILGALGSFLGFVGKLILFGVIAAVVIFVAWKIVQMVKNRSDLGGSAGIQMNFAKRAQDIFAKNVSNVEMTTCAKCGKAIKKDSKFCQFCGSKMNDNT